MKKIILLSTIASSLLLATNGDLMIGDGAKSTGMGGTGIAVSHGAESLYANPAMIKDVKGSEFSGYVTYFTPDVQFTSDASGRIPTGTSTNATSGANKSFIPGFAYVHRNNDHVVWGVSLAGTAGMGTDYVNSANSSGSFGMETQLQIAKLSIPVAYTAGDLTVAVAPVLQYSSLVMNYNTQAGRSNNKKDSSVGLGGTVGLAYDLGNVTLGALYKSKIEATYKNNISSALTDFGISSITSGDKLDQPAELGIGAAYKMGNSTFAADLKSVKWADAAGYSDFGWKNQTVYSLGYQYETPVWAIRAGYNYGKSPIVEQDGSATATRANYNNAAVNFFNLAGFPAIVEQHYTLGGDYSISDNLGLSLAFVYSPKVTQSFNTSDMTNGQIVQGGGVASTATSSSATVNHSQQAITLGATYKF
jgi:long-chain fatty acid transport protein